MISEKKVKVSVMLKLAVFAGLLVTNIFTFIIYASQQKDAITKKNKLEKEISDTNKKIEDFNTQAALLSEALVIWESMPRNSDNFYGIGVSNINDLVESLKESNQIASVDLQLSKPEMNQDYKAVKVGVESSNVKMTIRALTDIQIYQFFYDLAIALPGHITMQGFNIRSDAEITDNFLLSAAKDSKTIAVTAEIEFIWSELKDI